MAYSKFLIVGGNNGLKDKVNGLQLSVGSVKNAQPEKGDMVLGISHRVDDLANLRIELTDNFGAGNVIFAEGPADI